MNEITRKEFDDCTAAVRQLQLKVFGVSNPPPAEALPPVETLRRRCALVVGHRPGDQGAASAEGVGEWAFNAPLAEEIKVEVERGTRRAVEVLVVHRDDTSSGYGALPAKINALEPDFVIEMHLNGLDGPGGEDPQGTETLYAASSSKGKLLAGIVQGNMLANLQRRDRGLKPIANRDEARGRTILYGTKATCVIAEPGFIESAVEFNFLKVHRPALVAAYVNSILEAAATPALFS